MKPISIFLLILVCLSAEISFAQKPEPVNGFAIELKPVPWYREQISLWKKEVERNNQNSYAWYNYYRATRNATKLDTTDTRTSNEKSELQKKIVDDMEKAVPNSFEYNLCRWMIGGNDLAYLDYLKKAGELGEGRTEHLSDMMGWGEMERNLERRNEYARKWYESDIASPGLLYYNYNVINGLKPNAIILTGGDNDTYPVWLLQSQGIRTDITVLNVYLLQVDAYRNKIFKELGIEPWEMNPESLKKDSGENRIYGNSFEERTQERYHREIVKHIARNSKKHPVYVAITAGSQFTEPVEEQLYLTGLAYEYSDKTLDNMALLKRNFEQNYALDYLDKPFFNDISVYWVKHSSCNYLVPMLKLLEHYKESGDVQHQEWIKNKIRYTVKGRIEESEILKSIEQ